MNKKRIIHCVSAAASSFVFVPATILILIYVVTKSLDIVNINIRFVVLNLACAVLAGLAVYPFRSLAWYWAALAGPVIGFTGMMVLGFVIDSFMRR